MQNLKKFTRKPIRADIESSMTELKNKYTPNISNESSSKGLRETKKEL